MTSVAIMLVGIWLPFSPIGLWLGLVAPILYWPLLVVTLLLYVGLTQVVKMWLVRRLWIWKAAVTAESETPDKLITAPQPTGENEVCKNDN